MTFLIVQNGYSSELASLGKIKFFSELSEKRITKAVRESLRLKYGYLNVEVSCSACFVNGIWRGKCKVNGEELNYKIKQ